jgi:phage regulator Rha-like protein
MRTELVISKKSKLFCDSETVAKKFRKKHNKVVIKIEKLIDDLDLASKEVTLSVPYEIIKEEREYKGQAYNSYLMNQPFFSLLAGRINTKEALKWQAKFNDEFYHRRIQNQAIKRQIASNKADESYNAARQIAVKSRRGETDAIQNFIKYALCQGSKNADRYYTLYSKMQISALFNVKVKTKNVRKLLNAVQTNRLQICDDIVTDNVADYIEEGMFYKDIYKEVKKKVVAYADLVGKSDVPYNYKQAEQLELFG